MLKSVLIGVDGSPYGNSAIDLGIRWARLFDASLVGLGVVDEPEICGPEAVPLGGMAYKRYRDESLLVEVHLKVGRALDEFSARSAEAGVIQLYSTRIVLRHRDIQNFADSRGAKDSKEDNTLRSQVTAIRNHQEPSTPESEFT